MNSRKNACFSEEVKARLLYYVYRLIDPRNGETFYVGKGKGNRVFSHSLGSIEEDSLCEKMLRIRAIRNSGFEVSHIVHRHGMDEHTAFEVEAALIDAYPGVTNTIGGHGSNDYGVSHALELIERYAAESAIFQHKALLINVNKTALETSTYDAVRYAWRIDVKKARQAEVVLATHNGLIVGAYVAEEWMPATSENFPGRDTVEGRYGFIGYDAPHDIKEKYVRKKLPDEYRKKGAANPVKYTW